MLLRTVWGEGSAGVGPESVLGRGDDVVGGEMGHELLVDDGVEDFSDDREVRWVCSWLGLSCRRLCRVR